jgi:hypothetical protein
MTADEIISRAIDRGQAEGLVNLNTDERLVFLISEAEVCCDMDGIETLLNRYAPREIKECADAFMTIGAAEIGAVLSQIVTALPIRPEELLSRADTLIKDRIGYNYDSIRATVERRQTSKLDYTAERDSILPNWDAQEMIRRMKDSEKG